MAGKKPKKAAKKGKKPKKAPKEAASKKKKLVISSEEEEEEGSDTGMNLEEQDPEGSIYEDEGGGEEPEDWMIDQFFDNDAQASDLPKKKRARAKAKAAHKWSPVEEELLIRLILGSKAYGTNFTSMFRCFISLFSC
jgi:hypothetical protein